MNAISPPKPPIRRLLAFGPELNANAGAAFDAVWADVTRDTRWTEPELRAAKQLLAERIFNLAQKGIDDLDALRAEGRKLFRL